MKKVLTSILLMLLIFNFIFCNYTVYGEEGSTSATQNAYTEPVDTNEVTKGAAEMESSGTVNGKSTQSSSYGGSIVGTLLGALSRLVNIIFLQVDVLISHIANNPSAGGFSSTGTNGESFWFSIDKTVFNRVALFNINYFNTDNYKVGNQTIVADANNTKIKESIVTSYYICRILALAISAVILIYIGIRMAISSVATEQAKYKKMLLSWVESIVILFLMPYIMSLLFNVGESITEVFYNIRCSLIGKTVPGSTGTYGVFENTVRAKIFGTITQESGLGLAMWSIIYWILLFNELKFLWLYLKRVLMVGFLIIISPIITITYSIDKVGDGQAQAFNMWIKEFILNVFIQPLHAVIYLVFIFSANAIATSSPLLALALLFAMGQAERMVKVIFDMKGSVTLRGVNKFMKKG